MSDDDSDDLGFDQDDGDQDELQDQERDQDDATDDGEGEDNADAEVEGDADEDSASEESEDDEDEDEDGDGEVDEENEDEDEEDSEDEDGEDEEEQQHELEEMLEVDRSEQGSSSDERSPPRAQSAHTTSSPASTTRRRRSLSPAQLRKNALAAPINDPMRTPRSYTVEAILALPHPVPTHALASSFCISHLLTGSDDGYVRDYDLFAAANGKNFLSAPQRHHAGVVEGLMKAGQLRYWWENPVMPDYAAKHGYTEEESTLSPVYCLAMHSDALWALAGTDSGHINLFTVRHDPGRLCHVMNGHRGPVSALSMDYDEKGFFSAGWDGEVIQWDLNNGQIVRNFTAHGAQLTGVAVRPLNPKYAEPSPPVVSRSSEPPEDSPDPQPGQSDTSMSSISEAEVKPLNLSTSTYTDAPPNQYAPDPGSEPMFPAAQDMDSKSDGSYDPLFDADPDELDNNQKDVPMSSLDLPGAHESSLAMPMGTQPPQLQPQQPAPTLRATLGSIPPPKNAPPILDDASSATYSPDVLLTASIDGQVILWDRRVHTPGRGVGRLWMSEKTPPWCLSACWSADGGQIYAGRRNGTIDIWDVRQLGRSGPSNAPRLWKTLRNPTSSGVVSCVVAFPDCRHIACASIDNLRLWNVAEAGELDSMGKVRSGVQFKIIPGHHGGYISQMLVDPGARFLVSASSNRGWHGESTRTVFVHDIKTIW